MKYCFEHRWKLGRDLFGYIWVKVKDVTNKLLLIKLLFLCWCNSNGDNQTLLLIPHVKLAVLQSCTVFICLFIIKTEAQSFSHSSSSSSRPFDKDYWKESFHMPSSFGISKSPDSTTFKTFNWARYRGWF